jgi:two-component sensor histidine kinase
VNDAFSKTTGITQEGAVGQTLAELLAGSATDADAVEALKPRPSGAPGASRQATELVLYPQHASGDAEPIWASVELRPMGSTPGYSGLLLDVTEARAKAELEEVQRALSTELASANTTDEARLALVRALPHASAVLGVRLFRPGEPTASARAASTTSHIPSHSIEQALLSRPDETPDSQPEKSPTKAAENVSSLARSNQQPFSHTRARFALHDTSPCTLEVFFALDVPGRAALIARIPTLLEQLARHEHRLAEQARFEALFDRSPDALVLLDVSGRIARHNALAARLWPAVASASTADWPPELLAATALAPRLDDQDVRQVAWRSESHSQQGAGTRDLEASVTSLSLPDFPEGRGVLVSVRDVTERREAERSLERALAEVRTALSEREVLLKEIHHRVKNNLQIVSSLLSMQTDREVSNETRSALEESVQRVRSMSLIHQQLYGGNHLGRIELDEYVKTLAKELCASLAPTAKLELDTEPTEVDADQAVPCGLVLNELLVNALKHGRDASGGCRVRIAVRREDNRIRLEVADGGPGLPAGFDLAKVRRATTLGMRLVAALTRQLSATLTLEGTPGARFVLLVPSEEHTAAARGWTSARPTEGRPSLPM